MNLSALSRISPRVRVWVSVSIVYRIATGGHMVSWSQTKYQSWGGVLNSLQLQDGTLRQAGKNAVLALVHCLWWLSLLLSMKIVLMLATSFCFLIFS